MRLALLAVVTLLLTPATALATPRIVGGTPAAVTAIPYQVALLRGDGAGNAQDEFLCGGTILDATHVATAAHCVTDEDDPSLITPAADLQVLAGATNLSQGDGTPAAPVQKLQVSQVTRNPGYDAGTTDVDSTLLTLAAPLTYSARVQQIGLATSSAAGQLLVSGWGCTTQQNAEDDGCRDAEDYPDGLRSATVDVVPDDTCSTEYAGQIDAATMLCAAAPGKDSCYGDSGGPAVSAGTPGDLSTYRLAGITSFGNGCADSRYAGVYAEVANASVAATLTKRPAVATTAQPSAAPAISPSGTAAGTVLTCDPGAWTGSPTFTYRFDRADGVVVRAASGVPTYTRTAADGSLAITCTVLADTPVATTSLRSGDPLTAVAVTPKASPAPAPAPGPVPTAPSPAPVPVAPAPAPAPVTPAGPVVATPRDLRPPVLALTTTRAKVSKTGLLTLTLRAPGEAATSTATVTLTKRVKGKRVSLGRKTARSVKPTSPTVLRFRLSKANRAQLKRAHTLKATVVLTAVDAAGNRATKTVTVTLTR